VTPRGSLLTIWHQKQSRATPHARTRNSHEILIDLIVPIAPLFLFPFQGRNGRNGRNETAPKKKKRGNGTGSAATRSFISETWCFGVAGRICRIILNESLFSKRWKGLKKEQTLVILQLYQFYHVISQFSLVQDVPWSKSFWICDVNRHDVRTWPALWLERWGSHRITEGSENSASFQPQNCLTVEWKLETTGIQRPPKGFQGTITRCHKMSQDSM
jgi:hypothetical protein